MKGPGAQKPEDHTSARPSDKTGRSPSYSHSESLAATGANATPVNPQGPPSTGIIIFTGVKPNEKTLVVCQEIILYNYVLFSYFNYVLS